MGEPIRLWKGKEEVTVNGRAEADALVAKGWAVGPRPIDVDPVTAKQAPAGAQPVMPAADAEPAPAAKPTPKHAGEFGGGTNVAPNTRVDKGKIADVKRERVEDKAGK